MDDAMLWLWIFGAAMIVITSYSIHYTKLYDLALVGGDLGGLFDMAREITFVAARLQARDQHHGEDHRRAENPELV